VSSSFRINSAALAAVLLLAACSGGGGGGAALPVTPNSPAPAPDDWTTYAHDYQRTGFEQAANPVNAANVSQLRLAWRNAPDPACAQTAIANTVFADQASPLVANGLVYVADTCGVVSALSRDTGAVVWQRQLALAAGNPVSGVYGTPTLADGILFVPVWGDDAAPASGGYLAALDATSGAVKWTSQPLARGNMRGEPLVLGGYIFEGISGGDSDTGWINGGVAKLDEATGAVVATFTVAPPLGTYGDSDGGSSWTPISYDGRYIYFGTGNTRDRGGYQDSVVQLDPGTMTPTTYIVPTYDGGADEDVGGGEMLWGGNMYFSAKNGNFYGFSQLSTNVPLFKTLINTYSKPSGAGGISTPATDGTVMAVSSGYNQGNYQSDLNVFAVGSGAVKCKLRATNSNLWSYAAFLKGVGFTPLDNQLPVGTQPDPVNGPAPWFVAFDDNCNILWKANPVDILQFFYGGPAVVASGVYAVDLGGNVYSWKLPSASSKASASRQSLVRPAKRLQFRNHRYAPRGLPLRVY
jgi:hypothetical protein